MSKYKHSSFFQFDQSDAEIIQQKSCYKGFFKLDEYQLRHKLFAGGDSECFTREIFMRGDAVVLILYDQHRDQLVMIEQFRAGALNRSNSPWLLEFVAGMFKTNEDPVEVAIREAEEETGLVVKVEDVQPVFNFLSSPGGMDEQIHLYLAKVDSQKANGLHGLDEEHEDILVHQVPRIKAMELLAEGKISNAATIIGLQWLALNYMHI